ncbi:hypothetical protein ACEWY4_024457 [Coilia grayii]|uniref:Ig-like domain-containing protein n=1 Tax=Coilia grayii TaxID=363190 RepID=A0ABD1J1D0_9TELE
MSSTRYLKKGNICLVILCFSFNSHFAYVSSLDQWPRSADVTVGHATTLKCLFKDRPTTLNCHYIFFMKVNPREKVLNIMAINDKRKYLLQGNTTTSSCDLTIINAIREDSGIYYCSHPDYMPFIGHGSRITVVGNVNVAPFVELFSPSEFMDANIPLICRAVGAASSQLRVFWVVNGEEHIGLTESVWPEQNYPTTEVTQSQFWLPKSEWEARVECTCVVEANGRNISKSVQRKPDSGSHMCRVLLFGISLSALFLIVVVTTVLVLHTHKGKHGQYTAKRSSVTVSKILKGSSAHTHKHIYKEM